jgi:uncharacterized metal-binding protein
MGSTGCGDAAGNAGTNDSYEVVCIEKTKIKCQLCEQYAEKQKSKTVAVMSCEGARLRGEVARRAANILCHSLAPEKTVRICLGGAFTKDTGQRALVRDAPRLIAVEGCAINCSSRMMSGAVEGLSPEVINADRFYDFDRTLFGLEELPPEQIDSHARSVARKIADTL